MDIFNESLEFPPSLLLAETDNNVTNFYLDSSYIVYGSPYPLGIAMSFLGIFGTFFNLITVYVLVKAKSPGSFKVFLVSLTLMDLLYCIGNLPKIFIALGNVPKGWMLISYVIVDFGRIGSTFFTVILTVERYFAVSDPLKSLYWWTKPKMCLTLALGVGLSIIKNFPAWSFYVLCFKNQVTERATKKFSGITIWMTTVELVVTLLTVVVLNILIYKKTRKAMSARAEMTQHASETKTLAKIINIIVVTFICLHSFPRLFLLLTFICFYETLTINPTSFYIMILVALNSSTNWIIYCAAAKSLRDQYCRIFCKTRSRIGSLSSTSKAKMSNNFYI